jgi:hypothetical protein
LARSDPYADEMGKGIVGGSVLQFESAARVAGVLSGIPAEAKENGVFLGGQRCRLRVLWRATRKCRSLRGLRVRGGRHKVRQLGVKCLSMRTRPHRPFSPIEIIPRDRFQTNVILLRTALTSRGSS